ncbi:MAG: NACHT domain-containing protein, partial [Verrucomicrobiota bacterium]
PPPPPPPPPAPLTPALTAYLTHVARECNVVWCPGMTTTEAPLRLLEVYATLHTVEPRENREEEHLSESEGSRPERVSAMVSLLKHPRLALLGEPGGGKSTFLRYLALQLARHRLGDRQACADASWQTSLPPELRDYLPVWVELRRLPLPEAVLADPPQDWLWSKLWSDGTLAELKRQHPDLAQLLEEASAEGRILFLLDGLDEVTDPARREFIKKAVWQLVQCRHGRTTARQGERQNRFVLTCRERTWFSNWAIEDWDSRNHAAIRTVDRFNAEDRLVFLRAWFLEREHVQGAPGGRLVSLASIPLNLTMIAWLRGRARDAQLPFPNTRAAIYEQTIHAILWELDDRRKLLGPEERTLPQLVGQSPEDRRRFTRCLAEIAFESLRGGPLEVLPVLKKTDLQERLAMFKIPPGSKNPRAWEDYTAWAENVLRTVQCRAGLLKAERDDPGFYRFSHRSFQEYLAGVHLATADDFSTLAGEWLRGGTSSLAQVRAQ